MKIKGLILAIMIAITTSAIGQNPDVMLENQSKYSFAETIDKIKQAVSTGGWKVITTHNMQETMKKNGKEVLPVNVMELCNPQLAFRILSGDDQREASVFLPCRISVYEKADGKTYISRMNSPVFATYIGGDAAAVVNEAFEQAEKLISPLVDTDSSK